MSNEAKPRLLFLRFTQPNIPSFLQRHLQEHVRCLSQYFDVTVINDQSCDYKQLCEMYEPDISMFESGSYVGKRNVRNVSAYPSIPKVGFLSCDAYCPTRKKAIADMARWEISTFFGNSVSLGSYTPSIADNLFAWPNFVNPELYRDYSYPKVIPVLFSGSQASNYPWRNKIDRIVSQRYPSLHSPHFGFQWQKGKPSAASFFEGEKYAQLINSAWVAPTCGTISNEVVRKHFEIPACNTCLLTQKTAVLEAAGFADLVNCVFADDLDVLDKLNWLFDNPDELNRIIKAGKQLVDSRHTIRQRDQVFQWFTLHKKLKLGQKVVQPGPFLPLTIVEQDSGVTNGHVVSGGIDRVLMKQADEKLRLGSYDDAERLYRRCLNYHQPDIPEAKFRLILCLLHKGNFKSALASLREHFPTHRLVSKKEVEPDPTEWAWFIVALLCCGKNREAALRTDQFISIHNEELNRVRSVVGVLIGRRNDLMSNMSHPVHRASVHQPLDCAVEEWLVSFGRMLEACGQIKSANKLAVLTPTNHTCINEQLVSKTKHRSFRNTFLKYYLAAGSRLNRITQRMTSRSQHLVRRISGYTLNSSPLIAGDERADIIRLLQKEEIRSGVLIGATNGSWLTEAFIRGMHDNPNMPSAVCVNYDSPEFREFHRQFVNDASVTFRYVPGGAESLLASEENSDVVAVNCRDISKNEQHITARATLVLLGHINNRAGNEYFRAMLADENFALVVHEPAQFDGYAVFRRIALTRPTSRRLGVASADRSTSLTS